LADKTNTVPYPRSSANQPECATIADRLNVFLPFEKDHIEQAISDRFEQQVRRYPKRFAVKTSRESLTYSQINRLANQIAQVIINKFGTSNEPVALIFEQGTLLIAAILGTLKAGKAYVPLDPLHPKQRNAEVLQDSTTKLILTDTENFAYSSELVSKEICVFNLDELDSNTTMENIGLFIDPGRLAYIFYTSGTTGRPKGIADTHRNVLHNIMRYTNSLYISSTDRMTLLQSCCYSGSVSSLLGALLNGATSFPFNFQKKGSDRLASWLNQERITIYHSVPSIFRLIANGKYKYPDLRIIRLEGDQANPRDLELYKKFFPDTCVLVNGLGATEYGIVRQYFVNKQTPIPDSVVPIGYAVEDMEILIFDDDGRQLATDNVGEIAVRSHYLAPGYWRKQELTEKAFCNDINDASKRIFRTGDIGRLRSDGCLEYLGRKNYNLRLRGRWVEIPKIEKALYDLGVFNDILVTIIEDPDLYVRLVAYLVPGDSPFPKTDEIRQFLLRRLPDFMVPSVFIKVESIPLNSFGKVDRSALPTPGQIRPELSEPYVAPQNFMQNQLKQIWEKVLKIHPIGIRDNFFDLGGDSVLAAYLFSLIEKKIVRQELPITAIISSPTIEQLAAILSTNEWAAFWSSLVPIQPIGSKPPFFCVHTHEGNVVGFRDLSNNLGSGQPFYGLQALGLDVKSAAQNCFENIAAHYLEQIRSVQPHGPYILGGYCMGGTLALEMAQQLLVHGEKVALLVMIEAAHHNYPKFLSHTTPLLRAIYRIIDRADYEAATFRETKRRAKLSYLANIAKRIITKAQTKLKKITEPCLVRLGFQNAYSTIYGREVLGKKLRKAYRNYHPRPYHGHTVLFRAKKQPRGIVSDNTLGWNGLLSSLEIIEIPGHVRNVISEPRVQIVAKQINNLLERLQV
jgi:amino acid adenylation domain-containing protein